VSDPCVTMIPDIVLSSRYFLQISAIVFQSFGSMSSESFMNGDSIIGLHISLSSGAIFRIASLSVGIAAPDFGSNLEEMVPPVIMIAIFGSCLLASLLVGFAACWLRCLSVVSITFAFKI